MLNLSANSRNRKAENPEDRFRRSDTDFRKQLRWLMNEGGTIPMTITPDMASVMLELLNIDNRPLSAAHVKRLARQMKEGKWVYTRVPIIISDEGRLIDGQHRLSACVEAGVAIMVDVAFNAPDKAFSFIDQGKKRTPGDIFNIRGVPNAPLMAAAVNWVLKYEDGRIGDKSVYTPDDIFQAYKKHEKIQQSAWVSHSLQKSGARVIEPSVLVAFHYLCSKKDAPLADKFFRKIAEGFGWSSQNDPAFKLHQRLIRNLTAEQLKLPPVHKAAFLVRAWNAERAGKRVGILRWATHESFPEIR